MTMTTVWGLAVHLENTERLPLPWIWWSGPALALVALFFAWLFYRQMMRRSEGTERMQEIAQAVREGAMAYLKRQYLVVLVVFAVLFLVFLLLSYFNLQNPIVPFAFLTGGLFSGLWGFLRITTHPQTPAPAA